MKQPRVQGIRKEEAPKELDALFFDPPPKAKKAKMASKLTELQQQIDALQQQRDELLIKEKEEAIDSINELIKLYDIRPRDLEFEGVSRPTGPLVKSKVPVKYKIGKQSWSGRGRKPKWVEDHLANGGSLDDLLVK